MSAINVPLFLAIQDWPEEMLPLKRFFTSLGAQPLCAKKRLPEASVIIEYTCDGLGLRRAGKKDSPVTVDFVGGKVGHRRRFGGGKGQDIAKAVGLNKGVTPRVLDATGGLGRDAFVLATLGCQVTLLERSPIIGALLEDGLKRAALCGDVADIISRMGLIQGDAVGTMTAMLDEQKPYDVVYLDPMFPHRDKSALVKKEMQLFHSLIGDDKDANALLPPALALATHRVVIKRPRKAPFLADASPTYSLEGKTCRYDIHSLKRFAT
ncbi:class I SAM-dependent methyltransferase [Candidatus Sororendozoicomonas aggregata]|uniref:class I SAM-dependent methyltransferase n=1 Tax=Candidatus Sororendozoicomonas aggregata TaxID=3073239 RepID=UPI003B75C371